MKPTLPKKIIKRKTSKRSKSRNEEIQLEFKFALEETELKLPSIKKDKKVPMGLGRLAAFAGFILLLFQPLLAEQVNFNTTPPAKQFIEMYTHMTTTMDAYATNASIKYYPIFQKSYQKIKEIAVKRALKICEKQFDEFIYGYLVAKSSEILELITLVGKN